MGVYFNSLDRKYALGEDKMDLYLCYSDKQLGIELKVWRNGKPDPLQEGMAQLDGYLRKLGPPTGW